MRNYDYDRHWRKHSTSSKILFLFWLNSSILQLAEAIESVEAERGKDERIFFEPFEQPNELRVSSVCVFILTMLQPNPFKWVHRITAKSNFHFYFFLSFRTQSQCSTTTTTTAAMLECEQQTHGQYKVIRIIRLSSEHCALFSWLSISFAWLAGKNNATYLQCPRHFYEHVWKRNIPSFWI